MHTVVPLVSTSEDQNNLNILLGIKKEGSVWLVQFEFFNP